MIIKLTNTDSFMAPLKMKRWLIDNVGEEVVQCSGFYLCEGKGWKIGYWTKDKNFRKVIIDDERMATMFLLRWA